MNFKDNNKFGSWASNYLLVLLGLNLLEIEFEFLSFKDVTITTSTLARARGNAGQNATSLELFNKVAINGGPQLLLFQFLLYFGCADLVEDGFVFFGLCKRRK